MTNVVTTFAVKSPAMSEDVCLAMATEVIDGCALKNASQTHTSVARLDDGSIEVTWSTPKTWTDDIGGALGLHMSAWLMLTPLVPLSRPDTRTA